MKSFLFILVALVVCIQAHPASSQIDMAVDSCDLLANCSFENWALGDPLFWETSDFQVDAVQQWTDDFHDNPLIPPADNPGNIPDDRTSVKLEILSGDQGFPVFPVLFNFEDGAGFFIRSGERPAGFTGFYKLQIGEGDQLSISVAVEDSDPGQGLVGIGAGGIVLGSESNTDEWTQFFVPILYLDNEPSGNTVVFNSTFGLVNTAGATNAGSYALIDNVYATSEEISTASEAKVGLPSKFTLRGNYPNPFNPTTRVVLDLPTTSEVGIEIFDVAGKHVMSIPRRRVEAGSERGIDVDMASLPSGIYIYQTRIESASGASIVSGKMLLVK